MAALLDGLQFSPRRVTRARNSNLIRFLLTRKKHHSSAIAFLLVYYGSSMTRRYFFNRCNIKVRGRRARRCSAGSRGVSPGQIITLILLNTINSIKYEISPLPPNHLNPRGHPFAGFGICRNFVLHVISQNMLSNTKKKPPRRCAVFVVNSFVSR